MDIRLFYERTTGLLFPSPAIPSVETPWAVTTLNRTYNMCNGQATLGAFPLNRIILKPYVFCNLKRGGVFLLVRQIAEIKRDETANKGILLVLYSKRRSKMAGQYAFTRRSIAPNVHRVVLTVTWRKRRFVYHWLPESYASLGRKRTLSLWDLKFSYEAHCLLGYDAMWYCWSLQISGEVYCYHLQDGGVSWGNKQRILFAFFCLLFDLEDGGSTSFRNVSKLLSDFTVLCLITINNSSDQAAHYHIPGL
jgi:hypothetical protein